MAPAAAMISCTSSAHTKGASSSRVTWRPTKIMNMRDLSKDDDFLSHLLVEKLGTGAVPLLVHKMDSSRRLPKTDAGDLLRIVRRLVITKGPVQHATRQAVDELLALASVRYYLKPYTQKQINAFATHASRYFELYHPSGSIEISHTSRYSHRTGKSELCILATRQLQPGNVITELKGSMAHLTKEEDKELKRTDLRNTDIRRDFSVIHSRQMKKNHLFLGPARFVNHDCENNCELFREGKYITFRVIKPIAIGEEITAHYGDGYFGRKNRHCLCETCEKKGRGGYAPDHSDDEVHSGSESDSDSGSSDSDTSSNGSSSSDDESPGDKPQLNVNERRTRRGVYAIVQEEDEDEDESDEEDVMNTSRPLADAKDVPVEGETEIEVEGSSELSSLPSSRSSSNPSLRADSALALGLPTPDDSEPSPSSSLSPLPASVDRDLSTQPKSDQSTSFKSIISTRRQKARESVAADECVGSRTLLSKTARRLITPPLSEDTSSLPDTSSSSSKRFTRSSASLAPPAKIPKKENDSRLPTPSQERNKGKDKERSRDEPEARVLRNRPSLSVVASDSGPKPPKKPDIPRGPDGKPLPTCVTCLNVLPVISVDSQVVWGLAFESSSPSKKGKKKQKLECPRCMRHLAIYDQPWPSRIPGQISTFTSTPREESSPMDSSARRVTHKALPALDRKLTAVASVSAKLRRQHVSVEERPPKRVKTEPLTKVEMSASARRTLMSTGRTRSGRNSLPSVKMQQRESGEQPMKRKRGRPRLSSPRRAPILLEKGLRPKSLAVQSQPRDSNGRFGKKGDEKEDWKSGSSEGTSDASPSQEGGESARELRAKERGRIKHSLEYDARENDEGEFNEDDHQIFTHVNQKRRIDMDDEDEDSDGSGTSSDRLSRPLKRPRTGSGFKGLGPRASYPLTVFPLGGFRKHNLSLFPSPNHFAARHSHSAEHAADAEEYSLHQAAGVETESLKEGTSVRYQYPREMQSTPGLGALTYRPSPFNFARRRWVTLKSSADDQVLPPDASKVPSISADSRDGAAKDEVTSHSPGAAAHRNYPNMPGRLGNRVKSIYSRWSLTHADIESSSSGEEDVILPESPDPSKFALQHRASFGSGGRVTAETTDDSEQAIERLVAVSDNSSPSSKEHAPVLWKDTSRDSQRLRRSTPFSRATTATPPSFVDAGWDSCSELSVDSCSN